MSVPDELEKLARLHAAGHLTDAEYAEQKRRLLDGGGSASQARQGEPPANYLVQAILATLFCCLPLGVVGIVYAAQVQGAWENENYAQARSYARKARDWTKYSFFAGLAVLVLYGLAVAILVIAEA